MNIFERVKQLNLPLGKYVVVGGAMEAHGIRKANDADIVVTPDLFQELIKNGWQVCDCEKCQALELQGYKRNMLKAEGVDVLSDYSWKDTYQADTEELIRNADIINGIPFVQLKELLKWKKAAARPKDIKDIELIESFLQNKDAAN